MDSFLRPAMALIVRLRFAGKFALLALVFALPCAAMVSLLYVQTQRDVANAGRERAGIAFILDAVALLNALNTHGAAAARTDKADGAGVDAALKALLAAESRSEGQFGSRERTQNLSDHWSAVGRMSAADKARAASEHRAMSDEILDLMYFLAERSRLLLDPEAKSAYLQDVGVSRLPEMTAAMADARALAALERTPQNALALAVAYQQARKNYENAGRGLVNAFGGSDVAFGDKRFASAKTAFERSANAFLDSLQAALTRTEGAANVDGASADEAIRDAVRLNEATLAHLDREIESRAARDRRTQLTLLAVIASSLALAAYLLLALSRSMGSALRDAGDLAGAISRGDLSSRLELRSRDEIGELGGSLNRMSERMAALVAKVKDSSGRVLAGARQVARASGDLSERTERQASSLEEMAAAAEELSAAVSQGAEKIVRAGSLVRGASVAAVASNRSMTLAKQSMDDIARASRKIADITSVIDGIAFQTNILALNAAVEAARVGESGRGFAVVAGEIRQLSQRSAIAAKEIKVLVAETVGSIEAAKTTVTQAGESITATLASVEGAALVMNDVGDMARQQSASIGQISSTVMEMNGVTQKNAGFSQQTMGIADAQERHASHLVASMDEFRLGTTQAPERAFAVLPAAGARGGDAALFAT
jgi:methyl-accepting chemotaxis protein